MKYKTDLVDINGNIYQRMRDISNMKFNNLTAIKFLFRTNDTSIWLFRCDCGKEKELPSKDVISSNTKSCGCKTYDRPKREKYTAILYKKDIFIDKLSNKNVLTQNVTGVIFNRLTAIEFMYMQKTNTSSHAIWKFKCECGKYKTARLSDIKQNNITSCGCSKNKNIKAKYNFIDVNIKNTYITWLQMKARCYNIKNKGFKYYGGRGIKVCDRWLESFDNFLLDMGTRTKDMSIERINVDGDYCPENTKWATDLEQAKNRTDTFNVTYNGINMCLKDCVRLHSKNRYDTVWKRLKAGWNLNEALTIKPNKSNSFLIKVIRGEIMDKIDLKDYIYD